MSDLSFDSDIQPHPSAVARLGWASVAGRPAGKCESAQNTLVVACHGRSYAVGFRARNDFPAAPLGYAPIAPLAALLHTGSSGPGVLHISDTVFGSQ